MESCICQNCRQKFSIEAEDFVFYDKMQVPPPTWCPECRLIRRYLFRNERKLFKRKDDATGKEIFSMMPPRDDIKVYNHNYWWSDKWDSSTYGRDYDFSRSFFEQFRGLLWDVPYFSNSTLNMVNSEFSGNAANCKNAYLVFAAESVEDSAYCVRIWYMRDCLDMYESMHDELSYDCVMLDESYRTFFSLDCESCTDVWFSKSLTGCTNCFGCVNLRNKSYFIFNKPYPKEEYAAKLKEFKLDSFMSVADGKKEAHAFWAKFPVKFIHGLRNIDSSGEHIQDSKNVKFSYFMHGCENVKFGQMLHETHDSYDYYGWGDPAAKIYESAICGYECSDLKFCLECWPNATEMEYCEFCHSSSRLFGCVGLNKKQYCILNKQYTKEEYEELVSKIKKHMEEMPYTDTRGRVYRYGEFFPTEFSIFAYNDSPAQDFFPLTREEAEKGGYTWREEEKREYGTTLDAVSLPDRIGDAQDSVTKEVIKCSGCARAYRIIPMELSFLRKVHLPLPRLCQECRFEERKKLVNPPKYWKRACQCAGEKSENGVYANTNLADHRHGLEHCQVEFDTSYAPEKPDIVYCEQCYNSELL